MSLAKFLTTLHDEVLEFRGEASNFTSLLRCACLTYAEQLRLRRNNEASAAAAGPKLSREGPGRQLEHST